MKKRSSKAKSSSKQTKEPGDRKSGKGREKEAGGMKSESKSGDIATLILRDHKPIKELLLILKDPDVSRAKKQPAFAEFERTLTSHAKAEEESLYLQLKQTDDLRIEGREGDTEHALAEQLIEEIRESESEEDIWMAKVKVLAELVDHHVKEEEKELLKEVRKEFSSEERTEIGETYLRLLSKYREDNSKQKKYNGIDEMRVEYV